VWWPGGKVGDIYAVPFIQCDCSMYGASDIS